MQESVAGWEEEPGLLLEAEPAKRQVVAVGREIAQAVRAEKVGELMLGAQAEAQGVVKEAIRLAVAMQG